MGRRRGRMSTVLVGILGLGLMLASIMVAVLVSEKARTDGLLAATEARLASVEDESKLMKQELETRIVSLNESNQDLVVERDALRSEFDSLSSRYESLQQEHSVLESGVSGTAQKIEQFQSELEGSLSWLRSNARLGHSLKEDAARDYVERDCFSDTGDSCRILSGCLYLVNDEFLGLTYQYDTKTSDAEDKLQSLREFSDNGGGDCEDYSLFFKAEWNYILERCAGKEVEASAWHPSVIPDASGESLVEHAKDVVL